MNEEFLKRKNSICALPFAGVTITPSGHISLCCAYGGTPLGHISEIDNLSNFYNGNALSTIRHTMIDQSISAIQGCSGCSSARKMQVPAHIDLANNNWRDITTKHFDQDWFSERAEPAPIRFLEYTCSNICNQACSTCNSLFSTKWNQIEQHMDPEVLEYFHRKVHNEYSLSPSDVDKIVSILPGLDFMTIKGGEPFADPRNIKILDTLIGCNDNCEVHIVTNMQSITPRVLQTLEKVKYTNIKLMLSASVDGIDKHYDWIRGGSFKRTVSNMERYYQATGQKIQINVFISMHNFFKLDSIVNYFRNKEYVDSIILLNTAIHPEYIRVENLPRSIIKDQNIKLVTFLSEVKDVRVKYNNPIIDYFTLQDSYTNMKKAFQWINHINNIRGYRLQDLVPELQDLEEMIS
jgi:hypothetical protein